jgi:hypothetical protein
MKKIVIVLALVALAIPVVASSAVVRISQIYGGGGSTATTPLPAFNQDYIELYNAGNSPVDISGWALEYGSATGAWGSFVDNYYVFPVGSVIPACGYILVGGKLLTTYTGAALPTIDYLANFSASGTGGKFALFTALQLNVACGLETPGTLVDKVSYGTTTNCAEGTLVGALTTLTAAIRNSGGYADTDNNIADFTVGTPAPRNSLTPINDICGMPVSTEVQSFGAMKALFR